MLVSNAAQATTAAGRTSGSFAVSPTGAATYAIPLWTPPGPHGMQPNLALVYSSSARGGPVGIGWALAGLSSIYRCNSTVAQDAAPAAITLTLTDAFCLDGKRLRLTTGTYGEAGSTYQTEVADFSNVTATGTTGNGPSYFEVQGSDGRTYTYGNGGSSQVLAGSTASAWLLNEVSDRPGNTMVITYSQSNGSAVPSTISWTPSTHGSSSYNDEIQFSYATNAVGSSKYWGLASHFQQNTNLLQSITITAAGSVVKYYALTYALSPTSAGDRLTQVKECADTAQSNCLLPTTITYQNGGVGVSTSGTAVTAIPWRDFNGDGRDDILYVTDNSIYVEFQTASGFSSPVLVATMSSPPAVAAGDLLGKGKSDILASNGGVWWWYAWNGSSFTGTSTGTPVDANSGAYLVDLNGDGLPDLVTVAGQGTADITVHARINTGQGSTVSFGSATTLTLNCGAQCAEILMVTGEPWSRLHQLDFNGDGRADLGLITVNYSVTPETESFQPYVSTSLGSTASFQSGPTQFTSPAPGPVVALNANDDACTDIAQGTTLWLSGCDGSSGTVVTLASSAYAALDWNGDGRDDLLVHNGSTVGVLLSTGTGMSGINSTALPFPASGSYLEVCDANGDGLNDVCVTGTGTSVTYYLHEGADQPPDLVASITDGYGNSVTPTYVAIDQSNYTQASDATYPDENYIGPMYVVSNATFSDPSATGGTYNQQFSYVGAWENLQGRGFEGFNSVQKLDSRNSLYYTNYYERGFPYTGMRYEHFVSNGTFNTINTTSILAPLVTLSSTQYQERYYAYFSNVTTTNTEVGGTENGDLVTTSSTIYTRDNWGNPTTIATTITDNDPGSPYKSTQWTITTTNTPDVDTTHWCLNLFTETQVAYGGGPSGSNAVTRTKTFTPDTTNCRYNTVVTEPNSSQYKVTETLEYDSFGNVNSESITGVAMGTSSPATRTTTTSWTTTSATTGQFPMSVTDPSGAQSQYNYNFSLGLKSSATDPNGLTSSWVYDSFGRKTQESRPDGTSTTWSYSDCNPSCLIGSHGTDVTHTVYAVGGSTVITDGTDYLDSVDRQLVSNARMFENGSYSRNEQRFDSLGRVSQVAMPCSWVALTTACPYWTTNSYDVLNRVTSSARPISSTNSNPQTTNYAYAGRTTTITDPQSHAKTLIKDVNGWLRQTKDPMGYNVTLAYDAAGAKTSVKDSLSNTLWSGTYNYGISAFLTSTTDMDEGSWSYTRDALGEKTAWTDAKGQSFSATYDALSRALTRVEPDYYIAWTYGSSASSHNIGKLQSVCTGTGSYPINCTAAPGYAEAETYDSDGRPSTRAITLPTQGTFTYTYGYNSTTGFLYTLTFPSVGGYAFELYYDYQNGILSEVNDNNTTQFWDAIHSDPAGHYIADAVGNAFVTGRSFDAVTGWLTSTESGVDGGSGLKNLGFLYDEMGNVTQRQDNNLGLTENVYYDNDYRLSYTKLGGTQNLSLTYDGTGNITSRSDVAGGATWTYDPTHKHQVTQAGSSSYAYSYDANGNMVTRQGASIGWTSYNYPTSANAGSGSTAESVSFQYGPDRKRWEQIYTGNGISETTYYIGPYMEEIISGGVTTYRYYVHGGAGPAAVISRTNGTNTQDYLMWDHQTSMSGITTSTGSSVVSESYTPFGNRRNPTTWSGAASNSDLTTSSGITRQGYTFQTALGLWMGLNHMNGRVEDAVTGRFLSADPKIPDPTNPQSYNRYSYANNNPLTFTDPTGFTTIWDWLTSTGGGGNSAAATYGAQGWQTTYSSTGAGWDGNGNWVPPAGTLTYTPNGSTTSYTISPNSTPAQLAAALNGALGVAAASGSTQGAAQGNQALPEGDQSGNIIATAACTGSGCPGQSTAPLTNLTYPNGVTVVDSVTGGPILVPEGVNELTNISIGQALQLAGPFEDLAVASIFIQGGAMDYQRTYSDNGNIVQQLVDYGYYNFGVVAAAAGYNLDELLFAAGIVNQGNNTSGPYGTNWPAIWNTMSGYKDYQMGLWTPPPTPTPLPIPNGTFL